VKSQRLRTMAVLVITAGLTISVGVLFAHHSIAGYDTRKEITTRGVVVEYNWKNPHVFILWNVTDESGNVVKWTGELSSPTTMMQLGMRKNSLKPGDEIIVTGNPSQTKNPITLIRKLTTAAGKPIIDKINPQ
jgi:hypothetical protein